MRPLPNGVSNHMDQKLAKKQQTFLHLEWQNLQPPSITHATYVYIHLPTTSCKTLWAKYPTMLSNNPLHTTTGPYLKAHVDNS